ncbi:MAG TPA: hypothetical protein VGP63_10790 [Planctomycetaceae bacterium]|nr:hypothetical protein [Planctomycetaceae bacterium]
MTVQHADLFHCLACGRVAYETQGGPAPDCCGQPMVRAVADVVQDFAPTRPLDTGVRAGVEDHALFAELVELAQWCHGLRDVDISRSDELANRLSVLHQALIEQVQDTRRVPAPVADPKSQIVVDRLREQGQRLLSTFAKFVAQLRNGPSPFENWGKVCDRLDEVVAEFRQYSQTENELSGASASKTGDCAR